METTAQAVPVSNKMLWIGRVLSGLTVLMLLMDSIMKLMHPTPAPVVDAMTKLGYPDGLTLGIGILLLVCTILYAIPQTAVLGAILLTGYLGGATASHVRVGADIFPVLFPGIMGALIWGGLFLRDSRLRALLPIRS
ncbi:membrane protein [Capsulimonas corticalis]|uniref:Membrane protein n=1 Tax=Capsulimonas corticalis TaxID=2219043 RepID=A0A402CR01_9BACT|nr:DoxX family protein [Capsulimonas corticalis]BDI34540.1 membrane protein [Capsulimonas corticalis]